MASEETIKKLIEAQKYQAGAWQKVIDEGRAYAQMKTFGSYVEKERVITVCFSDRKKMEEMFRDNLLRACDDAFREDALMGGMLAVSK